MPGDFIAEEFLRGLLKIIFYGIFYYTGAFTLSLVAFGRLRLAPPGAFGEKNKKERIDWSPWFHLPGRGKALKAEYVCLAGILVWILGGCFLYFATCGP